MMNLKVIGGEVGDENLGADGIALGAQSDAGTTGPGSTGTPSPVCTERDKGCTEPGAPSAVPAPKRAA